MSEIKHPHNVLSTLQESRRLIDEKGWTQRVFARDANGEMTDVFGDKATCYCILGALFASKGSAIYPARDILGSFIPATMDNHLPFFNDHPNTTKEMVLDVFDKAISKVEANG